MKNKKYKIFNYIIITVVLIIPFIYSFFYLKAYWDPYGEGNIDNLPVAIVNADKGSKGEDLVNEIKNSKKLKLSVVNSTKAEKGLYDKEYYAIINIPKDFTESMESADNTTKKHATITYSSNQKSNYLASQIINNVVSEVEKNIDNKVNSEIVGNLTETIKEVPDKLTTISTGFEELNQGTKQLQEGTTSLANNTSKLANNYNEFHIGIKNLQAGTNQLASSTKEFDSLLNGINELQTGVSTIQNGSNLYTANFSNYLTNINEVLTNTNSLANIIANTTCTKIASGSKDITEYDQNACLIATNLLQTNPTYENMNVIELLQTTGNTLETSTIELNQGINTLNNNISSLNNIEPQIKQLQTSTNKLLEGVNTISNNSSQIMTGINSLNQGAITLNNGMNTLNTNITTAKNQIDENINTTKKEITKVDGLKEYVSQPVKISNQAINEVPSYGTAFSPFFISIALWVGCLMLYIVLYYDKEERFKKLSINNSNYLQRTIYYHILATLSGILLGILLQLFLDFQITNLLLYYTSMILIANTFVAIMELLIVNFQDVGKFIALILLVLQLSASGGTFPIETVTESFRWLNPYLPMTYTIDLLRESLVTMESQLLTQNFITVFIIFIVFFIINITHDIIRNKKLK